MKKVVVNADLSMVSRKHQINITGNGGQLVVDIIGKSAFYLSYRQLISGYLLRKKLVYLDQDIQIKRNHKNLLTVKNGKMGIDNYAAVIKLILRSAFS